MRRKNKIVSLTLFLLLGFILSPVFGAEKSKKSKVDLSAGMQTPGTVKMIWDYKDQLGLSDSQVSDIKDTINGFQKNVIQFRSKLQVTELDIQDLLQKKADLTAIKTKLSESAEIQVDLRMADIETARKIDSILTPDQIKKWRAIQKKEATRENPSSSRRASPERP